MVNLRKKFAVSALFVGLILLLSACTSVQLGYRFLDDLIRWELNDYVTIQGQNSRDLDAALKTFHTWHRQEQLPLYQAFLTEQMQILQGDKINAAQLQRAYDKSMQFWQISMRQIAPDLADILSRLDQKQLAQLAKNMDKKNAEYEKKRIMPARDKRQQERVKRMRDTLKKWVGTLSTEQEARVEKWATELSYETAARLQQRQLMRERFDRMLGVLDKPQQLQQQLTQLIAMPAQQWTAAYRQYLTANRQLTYQLLIDLHATLTAAQKKKLLNKLEGYQQDFARLTST